MLKNSIIRICIVLFGAATILTGGRLLEALEDTNADAKATDGPTAADFATALDNPDWERATFAGGCFWGIEATFRNTAGVKATRVGYIGGSVDNPTYQQVCYTNTGHAEAVDIVFDPAQVSFRDLLHVFWEAHDPTQVNRQGPDIGDQYRTAIFVHSDSQMSAAEASKQALDSSGVHTRPIATIIEHAPTFWPAEEYHQQYLEKRGLSSCGIK